MFFYRFAAAFMAVSFLSVCAADAPEPPPDAAPAPAAAYAEAVWRGFDDAAWTYALDNGLSDDWAAWMLDHKDAYKEAYVRARTDRRVRVEVSYANPIAYDPPWTDEAEHMRALERMAELAFVGWDFSFALDDPQAEFFAVVGHRGTSYADGDTVYLVWEGIFLHEFAHLLGIGHHYCTASDLSAPCPDRPPGEGPCIMDRNAATWGPTEQFVLNLGQQRHDDEIGAAISDLNGRYPAGWP